MVTNGSGSDRSLSDLPLRIFHELISHSRAVANPVDAATLRRRILSKLRASNDGNAGRSGGRIATVREIVKISSPTLLRVLDPCLTRVECDRLLSRIHRECAARPLSALDMMRRTRRAAGNDHERNRSPSWSSAVVGKVPTGLPTLDSHLRGGLPVGSVAEVVGRAGAGKTHLAQQLCVLAARADGGAVYVDAEKKLSLPRLKEIALERFLEDRNRAGRQQEQRGRETQHAHELVDRLLENVSIHSLFTTRELMDTLDELEDEIILRNSQASAFVQGENGNDGSGRRLPVRVIVIDSIAAPIRRDFDMMGSLPNIAARRASAIFQIAKKLKQLAYDYQLAVVVVNQVGSASAPSRNDHQRNDALEIRDGEFSASLGTVWQYCVSTRIVLEHGDDPNSLHQENHSNGNPVRVASLAKSLASKRTKLHFDLRKRGLCEVTPA